MLFLHTWIQAVVSGIVPGSSIVWDGRCAAVIQLHHWVALVVQLGRWLKEEDVVAGCREGRSCLEVLRREGLGVWGRMSRG
jgi:hypothetical protein